ncbi:MipA/OmpV family protein [Marinibaculum pumilum]|uniref:MipA/OmpV family protein n=1 Tax=Marinibaculum pumilum TaxID=1766165 RepID=A0ABV7L207_9PROT
MNRISTLLCAGLTACATGLGAVDATFAQGMGRSAGGTGGLGDTLNHPEGWRFSVGIGPGILPTYAGSKEYRFLPAIRATAEYEGYSASLFGLGARADLFAPDQIEIGPILNFQFGRDDNEIAGLPGYEDAFYLGLYAAVEFKQVVGSHDSLRLEGTFEQNISDTGDGFRYGLSVGYGMPLSRSLLANLTLGAEFNDAQLMQREYGVTAAGAASSGLAVHDPGDGIEGVYATLFTGYRLTPQWGLFAVGSAKRLVGGAGDSPIVKQGSANQFIGGFGITYTF